MGKSQKNLFQLPAAGLDHVVRLAAADLAALRGRKLFLTGGTGFFGKWLLGVLHHANAELDLGLILMVLSRDPAPFLRRHPELAEAREIEFIQGDIAGFSFDDERNDFVIHAAADTTAFTNDADEAERSRAIVAGTKHVLDFARACGAQRLLYVSSGAVYGPAAAKSTGACEDDTETALPVIPYGRAKLAAEQACVESGVDTVIARAFAFLGPHLPLDAHFAAGNFLRDAHRGGPINVRGDGTALRSYLHPADLVVWLLRLLVQGQKGRAYNVGSDEAVTTAQLARLIAAAVSPTPEVVIQSIQPQGPQNIYLPNVDRARTELHLDVAIPLPEAIAHTLKFLNDQTPS